MDLSEVANLAIQFDHETDTVKFILPSTYDGKSLPTTGWGVRYQLSNTLGDIDLVEATLVEGNLEIEYSFQGGVVSRPGLVSLALQCIQDGKIVYQTVPGVIKVVRQIDPSNLPQDEDILSRYLQEFADLLAETSGEKTLAQQAAGAAAQSASDAEGFKTQAAGSATNAHNSELAAKGAEEGAGLIKNAIDELVASAPFQSVVEVAPILPTVAGVAEDIPAVAGAALAIPVVAGVADEVAEVAAIKEAVVAVDAEKANIGAVAAKLTEVGNVSDNMLAVQSAHTNMAAIIAAPTQASDAAIAKAAAEAARDKARKWSEEVENTLVEEGEYSAKHHALKAAASKTSAEASAAAALASKNAAEAAAASVLVTSYYGLRRRSDGVYSRTGAAVGMTPARSNGTYNPTVSDFRKVRPWADIRLCLTDRTNKVVAVQGDDNFLTMANAKNEDGSHVWNFGSLFYPFYQKIWTGVDENSFAFKEWDVSAVKLPGYNMHPAFVREDGTIRPYIVLLSYKTGEDVDGKVCSKPGVVPLTVTSTLSFDTKYTQLDPASAWLGNHFTTNDAWKILVCIEWGTMDIQSAVGQGISSSMPYSSSAIYQLTQATDNGNAVTIASSGQPFYAGMDVQIGSSYSNSSYAKNRKVLSVDTTTVPGSMIITVDGAPFSAPVGAWIVTWGQSDTVDNLLQIGTGCGWISQWGSESRSHVYIYGLVDPYANVFEFERGKMRKSKKFYINFNALTSAGITDPEAAGYTDCGEFSTGAATSGWISDFKIVTLGDRQTQLVSAIGGNSIGDQIYYADDARTGIYVCSRGGFWYYGLFSGPFFEFWYYSPADAYIFRGDRGIILEPALQAA